MKSYFQGTNVLSDRIIYTPSGFAKSHLLYLQEVGKLHALQPHTSSRQSLVSYLFFIVTEGSGTLTYNQHSYPLSTGSCVFVDCRNFYAHSTASEDLWTLHWIHFYGAGVPGIYEKYLERGGRPVFHPDTLSPFSNLLADLLSIAGSEDYVRDMVINEKISALLTLIMKESWHPENMLPAHGKKQAIHQIRTYLDEHYAEKISLDLLAEQFYLNKFYLSRIFKEQFGTTVMSYLDQVRITHAKHLLRFSDHTMEEIGREVGIEESSYFNRVFRKIEGITPGAYRKLW